MNPDRRSILRTTAHLAAGTALAVPALAAPALDRPQPRPDPEAFRLVVRLDTPLARGLELADDVVVDRPFAHKVRRDRGGIVAMSGMLLPFDAGAGKYPLLLSLLTYASQDEHALNAMMLRLALDKPYEWGSAQGVVHAYKATLTRRA